MIKKSLRQDKTGDNNMSEEQKKLINQHKVARRLGVVPSYVCMVLNGQRKGPKAHKLLERIIAIYVEQFKHAA